MRHCREWYLLSLVALTNQGRLGFLQESAVLLVPSCAITEKQKAPQRPFHWKSKEHLKHKMKRLPLLV